MGNRPDAEDVVVVRIDPQANRAVETVAVGGHPIDVEATEDAVWVSVARPGTLLRIAGRRLDLPSRRLTP
jgi:hypothetical protein